MIGTRPAGQHTVRQHNAALVLGAIADGPGTSRAGLAAATGLTKATVSTVVDRLIAADLVAEGEPEQRVGPGRRGTVLTLSPTGPHGLGVEIGVDYLASCLVDLTGTVRAQEVRYADNRTPRVFQRVSAFLRKARKHADALGVPVGGVGIAVPGLVESGLVRLAPNLGWRDVDLADRLGGTFTVANEANFAALAELWHGSALPDFVHVSGEIGIGAGIVLDRALFEGVRGAGGEIGHLPVAPDGPPCSCGANGCLERMAYQEEILRLAGADTVDALVAALESGANAAVSAVSTAMRPSRRRTVHSGQPDGRPGGGARRNLRAAGAVAARATPRRAGTPRAQHRVVAGAGHPLVARHRSRRSRSRRVGDPRHPRRSRAPSHDSLAIRSGRSGSVTPGNDASIACARSSMSARRTRRA